MMRRATGATLVLLFLAGAALAAPATARAGDAGTAGAQDRTSFWEKLRIRGRNEGPAKGRAHLPRVVARTQEGLRASAVGREAEGKAWLDLVDRGQAGAKELNDFAAFLVRRAHFAEAAVYQKAAIDLDPKNASLWVNLAMVDRSLGRTSDVGGACRRALSLDPNHALAHYLLGTAYEEKRNFDRAIAEYRTALLLDPRLGDAAFNPLVAYNEHISLVKMLNYRDRSGSVGLPLVRMTQGPPPASSNAPPAAEEPAPPAGSKPPEKPARAARRPKTPEKR